MGTCQRNGCNNKIWSHGFCRLDQWMRTDVDYKRAKEYAKENRKVKKRIPPESKKRKIQHIRYIDQHKMFIQENKDNGTYYCFMSKEGFDDTIDGFPNVHHTRGRSGDYYLDKTHWILVKNKYHLDVFNRSYTIPELKEMYPWFDDFMERYKEFDEVAWWKLKKREEKSQKDLFLSD